MRQKEERWQTGKMSARSTEMSWQLGKMRTQIGKMSARSTEMSWQLGKMSWQIPDLPSKIINLRGKGQFLMQKINKQWQRSLRLWGLFLLVAIIVVIIQGSPLPATELQAVDLKNLPASQYSSTITAPFNQPSYYPTQQAPPSNLYRPVADWVGRLILPTTKQYQEQSQEQSQQSAKAAPATDWVWFQVYSAPDTAKPLVGQTVRLTWNNTALTQKYVKLASRDVRFTPQTEKNWQTGTINPIRLNQRNQVGPLQSLAGAHPYDDVTVALWSPVTVDGQTLRIDRDPLQETGRFYTLVKFLEPVPPADPKALPQQCPGEPPCTSELMRVQHYNPKTRQFDGAIETIRIPQQPADVGGVFNMTTRDLAASPAGAAGWYVYGAKNQAGEFTAEALKPRSLFQLPAQQTILGVRNGIKYINYGNWKDLEKKQGSIQTVLVDSQAKTIETANSDWKIGDRALFLHNYGGRGGTHERHESYIAGTYAGHFSLGIAEIVTDPFTSEPIFDLTYFQVYGNGSDGTLSGGQTWANYMGNLRRGVMGTRPISDTLIKLDTLTEPYTFGDTKLSFFNELIGELSLVGARYRIGDGSGNSTITSATSCVQDSAQALFITLQRFKQRIEANPQIIEWLRQNPQDPTTERFKRLVQLGKDLAEQLTPMGVVRWDWQQNADILTGVEPNQQFLSIDNFQIKNLLTGLISWRTAMPRQGHDELAMLFFHNQASLWFLRSNIIGGNNPDIAPLEPTLLLGAWKLPGTQIAPAAWWVIRTFGGVTIPTPWQWLITLALILVFGALSLAIAVSQGFLHWQPWQAPWYRQLGALLHLLIVPALVQEYLFRVLLLPHPSEWVPDWSWWAWALLALGLFVGFQLLYARFLRRSLYASFSHPVGMSLITILGFTCTLIYRLTGSLWTIAIAHWVFASTWWLLLGGRQRAIGMAENAPEKYSAW